jgi:hypothetical protein
MKLGPVAVGTALVTLAFSGCGGSSTSGSQTTTTASTPSSAPGPAAVTPPPGTPAALRGRHGAVLVAGDLPGFTPQGYRPPSTSVQSWVAEYPPPQKAPEEASLKALGFVAGVTEQLGPAKGSAAPGEAISLVEQFRSARGAYGQVAAQLKQALARGETAFAVAGVPGARGWGSASSPPDANIAFPVGAYFYLIGFSSRTATHAQLTAAAGRLYRRARS